MKKFIALSAMVMFCAAFAGCSEKTPEQKMKDGAAEIKEGAADALKK